MFDGYTKAHPTGGSGLARWQSQGAATPSAQQLAAGTTPAPDAATPSAPAVTPPAGQPTMQGRARALLAQRRPPPAAAPAAPSPLAPPAPAVPTPTSLAPPPAAAPEVTSLAPPPAAPAPMAAPAPAPAPEDPAMAARQQQDRAYQIARDAALGMMQSGPYSGGLKQVSDPSAALAAFDNSGYNGQQALADGWLTGVGKAGWQR
jgi:hypothetical protein